MFKILSCGYKSTYSQGLVVDRPHGAPHYVFVCFRTSAEYLCEPHVKEIKNCCILLEPFRAHHYRSLSRPYADDWVHFLADRDGRRLLDDLKIPLNRPVPFAHYPRAEALLQQLAGLENKALTQRGALASGLLSSLFLELADEQLPPADGRKQNKYYEGFCSLRERIYQMPEQPYSIASLAAELKLSPSRFQHLYRDFFAKTPGEDIAAARLKRAQFLLLGSSESIADIALASGYGDAVQMIRHFNKYTGQSPGAFRRAEQNRRP